MGDIGLHGLRPIGVRFSLNQPMVQRTKSTEADLSAAINRLVEGIAAKEAKLAEQRSVARYSFNIPIALCPEVRNVPSPHEISAWALNISYEGIGLLTTNRLPPESAYYVNFEPLIGRACYVRIDLAYTKKLIDGVYQSGGRFLIPNSEIGDQTAPKAK